MEPEIEFSSLNNCFWIHYESGGLVSDRIANVEYVSNPLNGWRKFMPVEDHDRIVAELRAEVVGVKVAMHNAASGLSMEIKKRMLFEKQLLYARAEVEALRKLDIVTALNSVLDKKNETIATQARVIEIAKRVLNNAGLRPPDGGTPTVETICEDLSDAMTEIAAIEKSAGV